MIRATFTHGERTMLRWTTLALLAGLALACGSNHHGGSTTPPDGGTVTPPPGGGGDENPPPPPPPVARKCDGRIAIELRGATESPYGRVDLELGTPAATAARPIGIHDVLGGKVNVASDASYRVAVLDVPDDAGCIEFALPILGGEVDCIPLDRCMGAIRLHLNMALVSETLCHAVVYLDLWPSLTAAMTRDGLRPVFVPNYRMTYYQ